MSRPTRTLLGLGMTLAVGLAPLCAAPAGAAPVPRPTPIVQPTTTPVATSVPGAPAQLRTGWVVVDTHSGIPRHATFVVDARGHLTKIARALGQARAVDVSVDGRRVLFADYSKASARFSVLDLPTGRVSNFSTTLQADGRFANPAGTELVLNDAASQPVRVTDRGRLVTRYRGLSVPQADGRGMLFPDGTHLLASSARHDAILMVDRTGRTVRRFPAPRAQGFVSCTPQRLLGARQFLAVCTSSRGRGDQVFRYSLSSRAAVAETSWLPRRTTGYAGMFPSAAGAIVVTRPDAGQTRLGKVHGRRVVPLAGSGWLLGVMGRYSYWEVADRATSLYRLVRRDLVTGHESTLCPPYIDYRRLTTAILVDPRD